VGLRGYTGIRRERSSEVSLPELRQIFQCPHEFRIGFRKGGVRDCGEDRRNLRMGVEGRTMEINRQCIKRRGKTGFFVKMKLSRADTKKDA